MKTIIKKFPRPSPVNWTGNLEPYNWVVICYSDNFPPCVVAVYIEYASARIQRKQWVGSPEYNQSDDRYRNEICAIMGVTDLKIFN